MSAQKEVLSSSGTMRVTFRYLAMVTMSQICRKTQLKKMWATRSQPERQRQNAYR